MPLGHQPLSSVPVGKARPQNMGQYFRFFREAVRFTAGAVARRVTSTRLFGRLISTGNAERKVTAK